MDMIDLVEVWKVRGNLMKSVPKFMQGAYRTGMRQALDTVSLGEERGDDLLANSRVEIVSLAPPDVSLPPQSGRLGSKEDIVSQSGPLSKGSVGRTGRDGLHQFGGCGECQLQATKEIQGRRCGATCAQGFSHGPVG